MGGAVGTALFGGGPKHLDEDLRPIAERLKIDLPQACTLYEKFQEIDSDGSGCIDVDEFFAHIHQEPTPFGRKLFGLIDQNNSGAIDFNEFLVGLWNVCTFDDEALLRFAFNLIDKDSSGYVDEKEIEQCVRDVHGTKFDKRLVAHVKKVLKKYDKNKDGQFSFDEFKGCHRELPLLFMPAFMLKNHMEEEFYGAGFWKHAAKARKKERMAQNIREFMSFNDKCQKVAHPKFGAPDTAPRAKKWQARPDTDRMDLREMAAGQAPPKNVNRRMERINRDRTGVRRFSLDASERFGLNDDVPPERADVRRPNIIKEHKVSPEVASSGYAGPRHKNRRSSIEDDQARMARAKAKKKDKRGRSGSLPDISRAGGGRRLFQG